MSLLALNWQPQLRGILIIIIAVSVLMGSVYLILGTNVGARLGFLLSLSALSGWIMLMAFLWWTFGIGLKGADATWKPVPGKAILQTPEAVRDAGIIAKDAPLPADNADPTTISNALDKLIVDHSWIQLPESATMYGQAAAAAGTIIEADGTIKAGGYQVTNVYDIGGERYPKLGDSIDFLAFFHKPRYVIADVALLRPQRTEPGRAPASPEIDPSQPHRYVYLFRDLGDKRVPAACIAIGAMLVFLATCFMLHSRDRRVVSNRSAALARAKE